MLDEMDAVSLALLGVGVHGIADVSGGDAFRARRHVLPSGRCGTRHGLGRSGRPDSDALHGAGVGRGVLPTLLRGVLHSIYDQPNAKPVYAQFDRVLEGRR